MYLWDREHMERKIKVHMAYSRAHTFVTSYHMSQLQYLLAMTIVELIVNNHT